MNIRKSTLVFVIVCSVALVGWYRAHFIYVDRAYGCDIRIAPGFMELNNANIVEALRALKYGAPVHYRTVCSNVHTIHPKMACGGWQGGCYEGDLGEITTGTTHNEFVAWTAAVIAHEACHDVQHREGRGYSEEECYVVSHDVLRTLVDYIP